MRMSHIDQPLMLDGAAQAAAAQGPSQDIARRILGEDVDPIDYSPSMA